MASLPLSFIENQGQTDAIVKFMVKASSKTIFFTDSEVVIANQMDNNTTVLRMEFVGSNATNVVGINPLPGVANFFIGNNSSAWIDNATMYEGIRYTDLYPGVDLVFMGRNGSLQHEIILQPQVDPSIIKTTLAGIGGAAFRGNGSPAYEAGDKNDTNMTFLTGETNRTIATLETLSSLKSGSISGWDLLGDLGNGERQIDTSFDNASALNSTHGNVMVVPAIAEMLAISTYLGGSGNDYGNAICLDGLGRIWVAGSTTSSNFPLINPARPAYSGNLDAFLTCLSPDGTTILSSTYIGGSGDDDCFGVTTISNGAVFITGETSSPDYPLANPIQGLKKGPTDVFISMLTPTGSALTFSTYFGGDGSDGGKAIHGGVSGYVFVTGYTQSQNFPLLRYFKGSLSGSRDAFVMGFSPQNGQLYYSTYLGGSGADTGYSIFAGGYDGMDLFVAGQTFSSDFPMQNPIRSTLAGLSDAFVAKIHPQNRLEFSTYLGGGGEEIAYGIVMSGGAIFVTGSTSSVDFPVFTQIQQANAGGNDAFVSCIPQMGGAFLYSTYLGGNGADTGRSIAVDANGNAYVTGYTSSTNFPTINAYQPVRGGGVDAFISRINPNGAGLSYSTYLGGGGSDYALGIALKSIDGSVWVCGETSSSDFPIKNAWQIAPGGAKDAFISKMYPRPATPAAPSGPASGATNVACTFSTLWVDPAGYSAKIKIDWGDGTTSEAGMMNSWQNVAMMHTWTRGGIFAVKAMAINEQGVTSDWSSPASISINTPPNRPEKPSGPASGIVGTEYSFTTSAVDLDGHKVKIAMQFGDGATAEGVLVNSGQPVTLQHTWNAGGVFEVKAIATDEKSASSQMSEPLYVDINTPPNRPEKPSGPASGVVGTEYSYTTSAVDLDGHKVLITIDWGDGTTAESAEVNSGEEVILSHIWKLPGKYKLTAKATDELGAQSDQSDIFEVTINKIDTLGLFNQFSKEFSLDTNGDGAVDKTISFGRAGDQPIAGDWDGDGIDGIGYLRPMHKKFYLDDDLDGTADQVVNQGAIGDLPVSGDWDGDGIDGIGYYRPIKRSFYLDNDRNGVIDKTVSFGRFADLPICGDWNGDGIDTWGVFRQLDRTFRLDADGDGVEDIVITFGQPGNRPLAGDWDADGTDGIGVFNTPDRKFLLCNDLLGAIDASTSLDDHNGLPISGRFT
jgi:hypothetical protein